MTDKFQLDHATDSGTKMRYFIIHGPLPKGLTIDAYGYPICDSMNRHHCISPEEDEANGQMIVAALNVYATDWADIDWARIECVNCGNGVYLTRDATWFHKKNSQSGCGAGDLRAVPDLYRAMRDIGVEPRHPTGCVCADCSGAELTADND